jgi:hypothetical protein
VFAGDKRNLADMRRSGAIELEAGEATPSATAAKLANSIDTATRPTSQLAAGGRSPESGASADPRREQMMGKNWNWFQHVPCQAKVYLGAKPLERWRSRQDSNLRPSA